eukprot:TRINITY_DN12385_c0_g4_i1.p1 TRINITY_DN12385_c0_g4~~TRINITY_DN12385_c0_g4_i1.p1  ORF type:complete len:1717 (+),score=489.72 TRINITY_DN12385_c0_g4_i1:522-5153(+)
MESLEEPVEERDPWGQVYVRDAASRERGHLYSVLDMMGEPRQLSRQNAMRRHRGLIAQARGSHGRPSHQPYPYQHVEVAPGPEHPLMTLNAHIPTATDGATRSQGRHARAAEASVMHAMQRAMNEGRLDTMSGWAGRPQSMQFFASDGQPIIAQLGDREISVHMPTSQMADGRHRTVSDPSNAQRLKHEMSIIHGDRPVAAIRVVIQLYASLLEEFKVAEAKRKEAEAKAKAEADARAAEEAKKAEQEAKAKAEAEAKAKAEEEARLAEERAAEAARIAQEEAEAAARVSNDGESAENSGPDVQAQGDGGQGSNADEGGAPTGGDEAADGEGQAGDGDDDAQAGEPAATAEPLPEFHNEFLGLLPEDIRDQVLQAQAIVMEVPALADESLNCLNPEFLAALPPDLQREVLQQERQQLESMRRNLQGSSNNGGATESSGAPAELDVASMIATLDPALRREVLLENSENQEFLQQLPPAVMHEAQTLRQEVLSRRHQALREQQRAIRQEHRQILSGTARTQAKPNLKNKDGQQILDQEHLNLLLWTLFSPNPVYAKALAAVFRRLCAHSKTRNYVISSLISICEQLADVSYGVVDDVPAQVQLLLQANQDRVVFRSKPSVVKLSLELIATILGAESRAAVAFLGDARSPPMAVGRKASFWIFLLDLAANDKPLPDPVKQLHNAWSNRKRRSRSNSLTGASTPALDVLFKVLAVAPTLEEAHVLPEAMRCLSALFSTLPTHQQKAEYHVAMAKFKRDHPEQASQLLSPKLRRAQSTTSGDGKTDVKDTESKIVPPTPVMSYPVIAEEHADRLLTAIERSAGQGVGQNSDSKILTPLVRSQKNAEAVVKALRNHIFDWRDRLQSQIGKLEAIIVQAAGKPGESRDGASMDEGEEQSIEDSAELRFHLNSMNDRGSAQDVLLRLLTMASVLQREGVLSCPCLARPKAAEPASDEKDQEQTSAHEGQADADNTGDAEAQATPAEGETVTNMETAEDSADGKEGEGDKAVKAKSDDSVKNELPSVDKLVESYKVEPVELIIDMEVLWSTIGQCLSCLDRYANSDQIISSLQPIVEAFLLCHQDIEPVRRPAVTHGAPASSSSTPAGLARSFSFNAQTGPGTEEGRDREKRYLQFLETHRSVINEVIKKSPKLLGQEPYSILTKFPMVLDFDVKEKYFRKKLQSSSSYRHSRVRLRIRRDYLFEDSYNQVIRLSDNQLNAKFDVQFAGEEGIDAGGLLREWYYKVSQAMMNPNYALFCQSTPGSETYQPNLHSGINADHLQYFRFCGRVVAKAIYDNQLLDCHFTRAFYKQILGLPVSWRDLGAVDEGMYKNLLFVLDNDMTPLEGDFTFSMDIDRFGKIETIDLKENGREISVTEDNKKEYVRLVANMKLTEAIKEQIAAFQKGFYEIIAQEDIALFDESELELLISGLPDVDLDDLRANTEYKAGYNSSSPQIQWFWRCLRSFSQNERVKLIQFVTGTGKIPVGGFGQLVGMSGPTKFNIHKDRSGHHRLPQAHTCFNQLDLPEYESYEQLKDSLKLAITEASEGFGFG